jgi:hypothetical protein
MDRSEYQKAPWAVTTNRDGVKGGTQAEYNRNTAEDTAKTCIFGETKNLNPD